MDRTDRVTNIIMVGVGGQGVILASEIIAEVMMRAGFDVKKSEVHGMAQRGGMVNSHVRFGAKVYSPVIKKGAADILLSFEQLETLRFLDYLVDNALIILDTQKISPPSVTTGNKVYPPDIPARLAEKYSRLELIDAVAIATEAGNLKAANIAFLGVLSRYLSVEAELWKDTISQFVPSNFLEVNLKAFSMGRLSNKGRGKKFL